MVRLTERSGTLSEAQCATVISRYRERLVRSGASDMDGKRIISPTRTSFGFKIPRGDLQPDIANALHEAVVETTGVSDSDRVEPWSLLHYGQDDCYRTHVDWFSPAQSILFINGGQRTHSVILYLSTVERGGETFFPIIRRIITPCIGLLVAWNNTFGERTLFETLHESKPVEAGEKWALVTWVRERTFASVKDGEDATDIYRNPVPQR